MNTHKASKTSPENLHFPGQKPGEVVHCILNKHWIVYMKLVMFFLIMVGLPGVGYFVLEAQGTGGFDFTSNTHRWITIVFLIYVNFILLMAFIRWLEEDMDIILVTSERIISIEQLSFFHRTVSETELSQVQDVKHMAKGILSNLLNFGDMEVQTAGEKVVFIMKDVANGEARTSQVLNLCREYKRHAGGAPLSQPGSSSQPLIS